MMSFCVLLEGCIHYESIGLRVNRDDTTLNPGRSSELPSCS